LKFPSSKKGFTYFSSNLSKNSLSIYRNVVFAEGENITVLTFNSALKLVQETPFFKSGCKDMAM
jgi:hypothetical protein